jgi:hypothetical protein
MPGNSVTVDSATFRLLTQRNNLDLIVVAAASVTAQIMIDNISSKSGGGKAYKRKGGLGYHIASAPGEFPAKDSGALAAGISVNLGRNPDESDVQIKSEYALDLEFGTSKMASRPFIISSLNQAMSTRLPEIINTVVSYINNGNSSGSSSTSSSSQVSRVSPYLQQTIRDASNDIAEAKAGLADIIDRRSGYSDVSTPGKSPTTSSRE